MELRTETLLYYSLHWSSGMNCEVGGAGGIPERIKHNLTFPPVWSLHRQRAQVLPAGMCSDMALKDRCPDMPVSCYVERLAGSKGQGYTARTLRVAAVPCVSLVRGLSGAWIFDLYQQSFCLSIRVHEVGLINPLNPELNPICYLLALLGAHHFLQVSRIRVKLLTFRLLMSYIYGAPILDVSRSHTTTQHSR